MHPMVEYDWKLMLWTALPVLLTSMEEPPSL